MINPDPCQMMASIGRLVIHPLATHAGRQPEGLPPPNYLVVVSLVLAVTLLVNQITAVAAGASLSFSPNTPNRYIAADGLAGLAGHNAVRLRPSAGRNVIIQRLLLTPHEPLLLLLLD